MDPEPPVGNEIVPRATVVEGLPLDHTQVHLVENVDDAFEFMRWLSTHRQVAFDTETTGLDHDTDSARLVQYGDGRDGWVIPFELWSGLVVDAVRRYDGEYIMHNLPFDWIMMRHADITIPRHRCHDTRLEAHVLWSTGPLGLKPLCTRHVDPRAATAQQVLNDGIGQHGGWTWGNVPWNFQPYWVYAGLDPILTWHLHHHLHPRVTAEAPRSYELELASQWVCEDMGRRGAHVDRAYTQSLHDQMTVYIDQVARWCVDSYGVKPGSNDAVADRLVREGVNLFKRTKGGKLSVAKDVLAGITHPLAQAVLGHRQAVKITSTYLRHYLELSTRDGRIHPSINTVGGRAKNPFEQGGEAGVRTGRMSMDTPNLQNVPIRTKEGKAIRDAFDAACGAWCGCGEPHSWVKFDFDQIEFRIFTHLAGDPAMRHMFTSDVDPFLRATRDVFVDEGIVKSDVRRQHMKNAFYAKLYAAGVEQFARTAGMYVRTNDPWTGQPDDSLDLVSAQAFLTQLDARYPGIRRLQREIETEANVRLRDEGEAYVRSPLTNRKYVADPGREYALMNYEVQGAAGEILKMKLVAADQAGIGRYLTLPVHDELDLDVPTHMLPDVLATLRDVMNDDQLLSVPITATGSIGQRWGSVEDIQ